MSGALNEKELRERLRKFWAGKIRWCVSMAKLTTLKVGGPAQALITPGNRAEAIRLINGCRAENIPWYVVGGGSNLLVAEAGFAGVVINLTRDLGGIRVVGGDEHGRTLVEAEAGCRLAKLLNWSVDKGLAGLEFAAGIPGTVGGAVIMNAGAWGKETKDVVASLTWLAGGEVVVRERRELDFTYRCLHRPADAVVLSAVFAFSSGNGALIGEVCREHVTARRRKQPGAHGLAGSFFKNPEGGAAAGKLIEEAGLKGARRGGAMVSEVHANFIVNTGNATADDIFRLMDLVRTRVREVHRVELEPEVKILGDLPGREPV